MIRRKKLTYSEMMEKYPDWPLTSAGLYGREETEEMTAMSRQKKKSIVGHYVRFLQDHGLVRTTLCEMAPDIPEDFTVYLRDISQEGYEFHQLAYMNWLNKLDRRVDSDPGDVEILEKVLLKLRESGGS